MSGGMWICFEADQPSGWSEADFAQFVSRHTWTFARTMPRNSHEYTLRRNTLEGTFDAAVRFIREHGVMESFAGKPYKTLHLGEHKYWTMGAALQVTILTNRKALMADRSPEIKSSREA